MIIRFSILVLLSLSISSCISTHQIPLIDMSKETVDLPFKIDKLEIIDIRDTLLPMNWDVPMMSAKKSEWKGNPELSELNKNDIETIIRKSEKFEGIPVTMEFKIIEGVCELQADWKSVKEYAKFKAELFIEIPSRNYSYKSYAEMYYDHPTLNGTEKGTLRLYNQAVKNVTHMVLKQIKDEIKL